MPSVGRFAEPVPTAQAEVVVKNFVIDNFAQRCPQCAARGAAAQGTTDVPSEAAKGCSCGACEPAYGAAYFGTAQCAGGTTIGSDDGAYRAAGFTAPVPAINAR